MKTKIITECKGSHVFYIEEFPEGLFRTCEQCGFIEGQVYDYLNNKALVETPSCEWTEMLIDIGGDG